MKKTKIHLMNILSALLLICIFYSCKKDQINIDKVSIKQNIINSLRDSISIEEFNTIDTTKTKLYNLRNGNSLIQISEKDSSKIILIEFNDKNKIIKGKKIFVNNVQNTNIAFERISVFELNNNVSVKQIEFNFSKSINKNKLHSNYLKNIIRTNEETEIIIIDPTVTVIGIRKINNNNVKYAIDLQDLIGIGGYSNQFISLYPDYSNGSNTYEEPFSINIDNPEDKKPVDPKKMTDCFNNISDNGANYSLTIHSNLPIDNNPDKVINGIDAGHVFLTFSKSGSNGENLSQIIGFYPTSTILAGTTFNVGSQIVDDGLHKYGASYTIYINSGQFENAINQLLSISNYEYNLLTFNCTTFALSIFNAGGGNLNIQSFGFAPGLSYNTYPPMITNLPIYTPNSLYYKIQNLQNEGNRNTKIGIANASQSKGPCL